MKTILSVKNLKKYFLSKILGEMMWHWKALDGVDLEIESGKTFGIVGESGCGRLHLCVLYSDLLNLHQVQ